MKLRNKFLSLAMSMILFGGIIPQTNVSAAEIVNTIPEGNASSQLISALQMIYSCKSLREMITAVDGEGEIGKLFARMQSTEESQYLECSTQVPVPPSLGERFKDIKTTVDIMKKIFTDLEIGGFENNIHQINELTPDLLNSVDSDFFFVTNDDNQPHSDIPTALEKDGKAFELKCINVEQDNQDAVCLKDGNKWVIIKDKQIMPVGNEHSQIFCNAKLRNALYCKKESGLSGLGNSGNSCYFNAALQQLYNCESFRNIIETFVNMKFNNEMINNLHILFSMMQIGNVPRDTMNDLFGKYVDHANGDSAESAIMTILHGVKDTLPDFLLADFQSQGIDYYGMSYFTESDLQIEVNQDLIVNIFKALEIRQSSGNNILLSLESFCPPDGQPFVINCPNSVAFKNDRYSLKSMVVNVGGHYVTWIRGDGNDMWHCISDSTTRESIQGLNNVLQRINNANQKIFSVLYSKVN